jgi:hypothetical protein
MNAPVNFGPWQAGLDQAERVARLRALRALALARCRREREFIAALARAEHDPRELERAAVLLNRIPALPARRMLAVYQQLGNALH